MRVLVVTDSHLAAGAGSVVANWRAVAAYAARSRIDRTIHLGDITLDAMADGGQLEEALRIAADWPTPIDWLPGNHDAGENRDTDGVPERLWLTRGTLDRYRGVFGADRWAFEADGCTVVGLDAQLFGSGLDDEAVQWTWLDDVLASARGCVVCCLHKPLFEKLERDPDHHVRLVPHAARDRLLDRFAAHDVRLVLSGHAHQYLDRLHRGVRHVWVPSCAFVFPDGAQPRLAEKIVGVGVLELDRDGVRFDVVVPSGIERLRVEALDLPGFD